MKHYLHNSLRALFLSLAVLLSLPMLAEKVEIGGINYELVAKVKQATVVEKSSGDYSGEIIIPESVEHEGTAYSVTSIGDYAFSDCSGLTSVTIPNSVTSIGWCAFYECDGLTSVTIPNSVTSIGGRAFSGCSGLKSVTIPNSVESIGNYAFYQCSGLTSVTIPNSVTSIGYEAFWGCSGLTSVHISDIVAWCNIDFSNYAANPLYYALHLYLNGEEVKDLLIPNSVTSIGDNTFYGCDGLTSVTIPNSVKSIGSRAFCGCSGLTSVTIPNSVTSIGGGAFSNCSSLTSVTIPNSVTSIGGEAFWYCPGLTSVTIPNSVTSIGNYAFYKCSGLTSVTIPNSVTSIGQSAFSGCSGLTSVTIGNSVRTIGEEAFANCSELLDVYCYAEKVPSTKSNAFEGSYIEYVNLHVPDGSIESYKSTTPWSSFGKIMGLSGGEPEVEKCATPVVTYADGKLSMACETEGAEFITNVAAEDAKKYYDAEIEFSATYNIEVYATKSGYDNSDTISVALVWVENGEVNDENAIINIEATPVLVQSNGGVLNVSGVAKGTDVVVYTISGAEVARATATDGTATISTSLQSGIIVIVKFGNKSVKLKI